MKLIMLHSTGIVMLISTMTLALASSENYFIRHEPQVVSGAHSFRSIFSNRISQQTRHLEFRSNATCQTFQDDILGGIDPEQLGCTCTDTGGSGEVTLTCPNCDVVCNGALDFCVNVTVSIILVSQEPTVTYEVNYEYNGSRTDVFSYEQTEHYNGNNESDSLVIKVSNKSCSESNITYMCNGVNPNGNFFVNCSNIEAGAVFDSCANPNWDSNIPDTSVFVALRYTFNEFSCLQTESDTTQAPTPGSGQTSGHFVSIVCYIISIFISMLFM